MAHGWHGLFVDLQLIWLYASDYRKFCMGSNSVFQTDYAGSIPVARSARVRYLVSYMSLGELCSAPESRGPQK
jgi:hypothetical protein